MSNEFEGAYGLTVLCPIREGPTTGMSHANRIRAELASWGTGTDSPMSAVPTTHMCRLAVLDDVFYPGHPAKRDSLRSRYLLFTTNFNEDLPSYLELLRTEAGEAVERVWRHCVGFPGTGQVAAFREYFERCQIDSAIYFADYGNTVAEVLRALDMQQGFSALAAQTQGLPPADLRAAVGAFVAGLDARPTPHPGSALGGVRV